MSHRHSTDEAAPGVAELTAQIADTRDRLAGTVGELAAKADVGARVRGAADQAKESAGQAAERARRRIGRSGSRLKDRAGRTGHRARHAVEARAGDAAHRLRAGTSHASELAAGLADTAGAAVGRHPETSARELVLQTARYGAPVLAALGGAMLGTAAYLALSRRKH
ncbi:DUF3618 domain-containing protein [Streptomyces sp. NRRL B-24484]|uniref:DUF3618 domain-containing protein n=1 Tax=Streptomyces sp. NRRL B-24484 TaxID=1463833 RepID=UPI000694545A|nr:DUF3618 domain-containing protein [Streptomyces sp. NRRL B-24484]